MRVTENIDSRLAVALEYTEAAYWGKLYDSNTGLKVCASVIAGAFAGAVPEIDVLAMNRVIGLGVDREVTIEDIQDVIRFYKGAGTRRFFIQLSPFTIQEELNDMLLQQGFRHHNNWEKLIRKVEDPLPEIESSLNVVEVRPLEAKMYGQIITSSFDWHDTRLIEWLAASVGKPGYKHYFAMLDNTPVAAAALHTMNEYASMAFAGTLPEHRNIGAQSILLKQRILDAQEAGCRYIISETAEEKPDKPIPSYRNMLRFGFEPVYIRQNWIYEFR